MFVIIVYDVKAEKTQKICKYLRKWLTWKQNSVFEGHLTKSEVKKVEQWIENFVEEDEQILIYTVLQEKQIEKTVIGESEDATRFL